MLLFLLLVLGIPSFLFWYEAPTCFDGVQNQGEVRVDRGGPCTLLAPSEVDRPAILWSRSFEVVPGVYNAVAYIDNPNFDAGVRDVPYTFKLFDQSNILVAERQGRAYLVPNAITPVFEGAIQTGERRVARTFFEFLDEPQWERVGRPVSGIAVEERVLTGAGTTPRIDATITNSSFTDISDITVVATLFNAENIAIGSSETFISLLPRQSSEDIVFTWPQGFTETVTSIDIIPRAPFEE